MLKTRRNLKVMKNVDIIGKNSIVIFRIIHFISKGEVGFVFLIFL